MIRRGYATVCFAGVTAVSSLSALPLSHGGSDVRSQHQWDEAAARAWPFPKRKSLVSDPVREVSGEWYSEQLRFGFGPGTEWQTRRNTFQEGEEPSQREGGAPARRACWVRAPGLRGRSGTEGWTQVSLDYHFRGLTASLPLAVSGQIICNLSNGLLFALGSSPLSLHEGRGEEYCYLLKSHFAGATFL